MLGQPIENISSSKKHRNNVDFDSPVFSSGARSFCLPAECIVPPNAFGYTFSVVLNALSFKWSKTLRLVTKQLDDLVFL